MIDDSADYDDLPYLCDCGNEVECDGDTCTSCSDEYEIRLSQGGR